MTRWCPCCEKRVRLTAEQIEPDDYASYDLSIEDFDADSLTVQADVRLVLTCAECGETLLEGDASGNDLASFHPEDCPVEEDREPEVECVRMQVALTDEICKFKL